MGTKLGVHITPGSRNDYGKVTKAGMAVVFSIGEHGALLEAWTDSADKTITIYRDMTVFHNGDAPPHFPQMSVDEARKAADKYWPKLRAVYDSHPADYYQPTNEIGGSGDESLPSIRNLIAFETRLMELSEEDGGRHKLAVASLSGGTPGRFDRWVELIVPLIRRAGQGGHIYSRHAYGPGLLTNEDGSATDGNSGRPFKEAEYLRSQGIFTPMVITEAGPNAGYKFPGAGEFTRDVERFDRLCQQHDNIWGFCCWTYGDWRDGAPNIQGASPRLADYLKRQGELRRPVYPSPAIIDDGPADPAPEPVDPPPISALAYTVKSFAMSATEKQLEPGQKFTATWKLGIIGSKAWQGDFQMAYVDKSVDKTRDHQRVQMATKTAFSLQELTGRDNVQPGEDIILKLEMTAPEEPGRYASHWQVRSASGEVIGGTRFLFYQVRSKEQIVDQPASTAPTTSGPYKYRGPTVKFYTGLHGPASDGSWGREGFEGMIKELNLPLLLMSNGININFRHLGDPARNVVRLYWNPRVTTADEAYEEIRDDQLIHWWKQGYKRFIFFNEPQIRKEDGQSDEGMGIAWHSAEEFAQYLKVCLDRAKKEFPSIYLYTTPVTSNQAFDPWGWRDAIWKHNRRLVDGWCMHAYSGDNSDAQKAVSNILGQVKKLQRRYQLQIPVIVSEASVNFGHDAEQKAKVAHLLNKQAGQIPGLESLFWFAADWASDFDHNNEGWFRKGIAEAYLRQRT